MYCHNWKTHKKLLDAGGLGPCVYILQARGSGKLETERREVERLIASGRQVIYVRPDKNIRGTTLAGAIVDHDILTIEQLERADRIWNAWLKGK